MDVCYINPFMDSVKNLFKTMLDTELILSKPMICMEDIRCDVSAMIGFSGDATGCVVLCFPMTTAVKAASVFAGIEMTKDHEDFSDALGELANIVAGHAKGKLKGFNISISLPNVIIGKKHAVLKSKQTPRLVIPCDSSLGRFTVEVAMVVEKTQEVVRPEPATASVGAS